MTVSKSMVDDADAPAPDGADDAMDDDVAEGMLPDTRGIVANAKPSSTPIDTHQQPPTPIDNHQQQSSAAIIDSTHQQHPPTAHISNRP